MITFNVVNMTNEEISPYTVLFSAICQKVVELLKIDKPYELSVIFVDDDKIKAINHDYRGIDEITDVISFAALDDQTMFVSSEDNELGDIFIAINAIKRQAVLYQHSELREASFLFTHGLLHLLGYDHIDQQEEQAMFAQQDLILDDIIKR
ncbi:MAG: rRNA maturation RNase YbeY [Erysipelotrichaceae bacterium]|nr:rRNA maturation RNase YbeY [Erysipelotrichaceae bacterium]